MYLLPDSASSPPPGNTPPDPKTFAAMFLQRLPQLGPATYWQLLSNAGSLTALMETPASDLRGLLDPEACQRLA